MKIKTPEGEERFAVSHADSWDEAVKIVKKGVYDRKLELNSLYPAQLAASEAKKPTTPPAGGNQPVVPPQAHASSPGAPTSNNTPPVNA